MKKEYKIKENKTAELFGNIFMGIFLSSLVLCLILCISGFWYKENPIYGLGILFGSLPISFILNVISLFYSTLDKQSEEFLNQIQEKSKKASSLKELQEIYFELKDEAVDENGMIRIKYPLKVKSLLKELSDKYDAIKQYQENESKTFKKN